MVLRKCRNSITSLSKWYYEGFEIILRKLRKIFEMAFVRNKTKNRSIEIKKESAEIKNQFSKTKTRGQGV